MSVTDETTSMNRSVQSPSEGGTGIPRVYWVQTLDIRLVGSRYLESSSSGRSGGAPTPPPKRGNVSFHHPQPPPATRTSMSGSSSLSSVVSGLVRAQMGSSVPNNVQEDEVDHYVQELILREAKQKAERYGSLGIQAYLPP